MVLMCYDVNLTSEGLSFKDSWILPRTAGGISIEASFHSELISKGPAGYQVPNPPHQVKQTRQEY